MDYKDLLKDSTVLLTGGTGSWGYELVGQLLKEIQAKEIRIYSRGEMRQYSMKMYFSDPRLRFIIGDVRDRERVSYACRNVDFIIHLAALKHVPVCEENPEEAVKTNIVGTQHLITAAIEHGVKRFIDISTDKAVDPLNIYGVTKACAEKLCIAANDPAIRTRFACVRAGNVLGTNGSIIPLFKQQISASRDITITHADMTRFSMHVTEAIRLIFRALESMEGGEIFIPKVPACSVVRLAQVMKEALGNTASQITYIGIRPGEKMHEVLISKYEAHRTHDLGDYFVVLPATVMPHLEGAHGNVRQHPAVGAEYTSQNAPTLTAEELRALLAQGRWV